MMETQSNLEETFFNLKTLTLSRRGTELSQPDSTLTRETSESRNSSHHHILSAVTSCSILDRSIRMLKEQWKVLLVLLLVFINILVVALLHADLDHKIEDRIQQLQHRLPELHDQLTPLASSLKDAVPEKSVKHIFLSLASQQSELSSLREILKTNSDKLTSLEKRVKSSLGSKDMIFESVIREANISLCSNEEGKLLAPVDGVFRLEFSAKVHGNTYINRKMFEILKNSEILRHGGSVRIRYNGKENRSVECITTAREAKTCYFMNEILLVYLKTGDNLQIVNKFVEEGGEVYDLRFCMRITELEKVPGGAESLVITH